MIEAAVLGASGYGGGELLRRLAEHPCVRVAVATSATYAGQPVHAAFPGLAGRLDLRFAPADAGEAVSRCQAVFLARDNGVAMREARALVEGGCKVIDLSADFRFSDTAVYDAWYKGPHADPELAAEAVYGMPELHRERIRAARVVGNPGCYTTASILALAPLFARRTSTGPARQALVEPGSVVVDAKSGISGAGRSKFGLDYHYSEANESVSAYKAGGTHRHTPEIEQELSALAGEDVTVSFTPHLVPMTRGILATCYATLTEGLATGDLRELYRAFYVGEPFVHVSDGLPASKHVATTNMLHVGVVVDPRNRRATVVSAIDNLGKGMAGQAVQNMNLVLGLEETAGLTGGGVWP